MWGQIEKTKTEEKEKLMMSILSIYGDSAYAKQRLRHVGSTLSFLVVNSVLCGARFLFLFYKKTFIFQWLSLKWGDTHVDLWVGWGGMGSGGETLPLPVTAGVEGGESLQHFLADHISVRRQRWSLDSIPGILSGQECPEAVIWVVLVVPKQCWLHGTTREVVLPTLSGVCVYFGMLGGECGLLCHSTCSSFHASVRHSRFSVESESGCPVFPVQPRMLSFLIWGQQQGWPGPTVWALRSDHMSLRCSLRLEIRPKRPIGWPPKSRSPFPNRTWPVFSISVSAVYLQLLSARKQRRAGARNQE